MGLDFSRIPNLNFLREDHKISFYTKNQQNSTDRLENIGKNVGFGPKRGQFGPKRAQNGRNQIFPGTFTRLFHKYAQNVVNMQNQEDPMTRFREIAQNGPNRIFRAKS